MNDHRIWVHLGMQVVKSVCQAFGHLEHLEVVEGASAEHGGAHVRPVEVQHGGHVSQALEDDEGARSHARAEHLDGEKEQRKG